MPFTHRSSGGGAPIQTNSPIYDYSTGNGGAAPPTLDRAKFKTNAVNRVLPSPTGEAKGLLRNDMAKAKSVPSGGQYPFGPGKHEAFNVTAPNRTARLKPAVERGIPSGGAQARDSFNRRAGIHEQYGRNAGRRPSGK
jgi:hypothetical protein